MIVIEDQFADLVITDEDIDQLEVVGDLIWHIESVDKWIMRGATTLHPRGAAPVIRKLWPRLARARGAAEQQDRCEQVSLRTRPATYVEEGSGPFSREDLPA
jgi:hypothetical protein